MSHGEEKGWWEQNWKWVAGCGCFGCVGVPLLLFALIAGGVFTVFQGIKDHEAFAQAIAAVESNPEALERVGQPIRIGMMNNFSINDSFGKKTAKFEAPISGPEGSATIFVEGEAEGETWTLTSVRVRYSDGVEVELLDPDP